MKASSGTKSVAYSTTFSVQTLGPTSQGAAIEGNADHPQSRVLRAQLKLSTNSADEALADLEHVLRQDANHIEALYFRGQVMAQQHRWEKAADNLAKAAELETSSEVLRRDVGIAHG